MTWHDAAVEEGAQQSWTGMEHGIDLKVALQCFILQWNVQNDARNERNTQPVAHIARPPKTSNARPTSLYHSICRFAHVRAWIRRRYGSFPASWAVVYSDEDFFDFPVFFVNSLIFRESLAPLPNILKTAVSRGLCVKQSLKMLQNGPMSVNRTTRHGQHSDTDCSRSGVLIKRTQYDCLEEVASAAVVREHQSWDGQQLLPDRTCHGVRSTLSYEEPASEEKYPCFLLAQASGRCLTKRSLSREYDVS